MPKREPKGDPTVHRKGLVGFIKHESAVGGPDPHIKLVAWLAGELDSVLEKVWLAGCYMGPYVVASGEAIFQQWSPEDVLAHPDELREWLRDNWSGLPVRRERRPVRAPHKLAEYLAHYARWLDGGLDRLLAAGDDFEVAWDAVREIRYNGRYASLKLIETLRRVLSLAFELHDIRPAGGWSPRLTLSYLYPKHAELLNGGDALPNLATATSCATRIKHELLTEHGLRMDWFNLEVFLCDYKQAYDGKQYPGRAHDSEFGHYRTVAAHFGDSVDLGTLRARAALFPKRALAEARGWDGRRVELGEVFTRYGYTWSDLEFDYTRTTDLERPVRWDS